MKLYQTVSAISFIMVALTATTNAASFMGLGDLPGDEFYSYANCVSADGTVVVGMSYSDLGDEGFRWQNGIMTPLGDLYGGGYAIKQHFFCKFFFLLN